MKLKMLVSVLGALAVTVATLLPLPTVGPKAQAQQSCLSFHALLQARLFPDDLLRPDDAWGGDIAAYLGQEFLHGYASMNDGSETWRRWVGMGSETSNLYDFGNGNTLIVSSIHSTFPTPPGHGSSATTIVGQYQASGKIMSGTGRFQNASGTLNISGPWLAYDLDKPLPHGRWNGEVNGNVCGVQ